MKNSFDSEHLPFRSSVEYIFWGGNDPVLSKGLRKIFSAAIVSEDKDADVNIIYFFSLVFPVSYAVSPLTGKLLYHYGKILRAFNRHFPSCSEYGAIEQIIHANIRFWTMTLNSLPIKGIFFFNIPHEGPDMILYLLAQNKKIRILIGYQSLFTGRSFILESFLDRLKYIKQSRLRKSSFEAEKREAEVDLWYMKKEPLLRKAILFIKRALKASAMQNLSVMQNYFAYRFKKLQKLPSAPYITFFLHLQPELTTSVLSDYYHDQLAAILDLRKALPMSLLLLVKENPKQSFYNRPKSFWHALSKIQGVEYFFQSKITNEQIISDSTAIATITGTVGWEALLMTRPVIIFGRTWYDYFPGVVRFKNKFLEKEKSLMSEIKKAEEKLNKIKIEPPEEVLHSFCVDTQYYTPHKIDIEENATSILTFLQEIKF